VTLLQAIQKVMEGRSLTREESGAAIEAMLTGTAPASQMAALLVALRMKGETPDEIAGAAQAMRARAVRVEVPLDRLIDTCGTGGDGAHTFNISTASAFVAAAAGARVAKHGNRAASSKCGSADVLAALGAEVELAPAQVASCIEECGIGFLFAPAHHAAHRSSSRSSRGRSPSWARSALSWCMVTAGSTRSPPPAPPSSPRRGTDRFARCR
jgi:anthranilate phosphoribosyltransferase